MVCNYALSCIDWWGLYTICGNKTANIGILALQAATVERYLHLPKNDCQSFNKSLNRTAPAATYKNRVKSPQRFCLCNRSRWGMISHRTCTPLVKTLFTF